MKKLLKKKSGITLIALVITIIVLLILAGISISMISSQDGILGKTKDAKIKTERAGIKEKIQLAVMSSLNDNGVLEIGLLKTEIENLGGKLTNTDFPAKVELNNNIFYIWSNGNVKEQTEISTPEIEVQVFDIYSDSMNTKVTLKNENDIEGKVTYKYYIKLASTSENAYNLKHTGAEDSYNFGGLTSSNSYTIKVEAIDEMGNVGSTTVTAGTKCFVAGTKVLTEYGLKNIEDIKVNEKVWSVNKDTNDRELKTVLSLYKGKTSEIYELTVGDELIRATPKHEFYIVDKGWVRAYELEVGDSLISKANKDKTISKINHIYLDEPIDVYNLTVEGNHNYLITESELLVHNAGSITSPSVSRQEGYEDCYYITYRFGELNNEDIKDAILNVNYGAMDTNGFIEKFFPDILDEGYTKVSEFVNVAEGSDGQLSEDGKWVLNLILYGLTNDITDVKCVYYNQENEEFELIDVDEMDNTSKKITITLDELGTMMFIGK